MTIRFENLPDPYSTDLRRWADELVRQNSTIPMLSPFDSWQVWANRVIEIVSLDIQSIPRTVGYFDWRPWAAEFKKAVGA